mmetsp:Transcript_17101/g.20242  ORF Transcript_17101/g.20242 Transcript_17101/m.20242 type:complete len:97 (-) Transcript_17101:825-1115(-)
MSDSSELEIVRVSNYLAIGVLAHLCVIFIILFFFMCAKKQAWSSLEFFSRYGSYFEGTKYDNETYFRSVLLLTSAYYLRRILLCVSLVFMQDFLWG